ncbi:MAG: hypothetical protein LBL82_05465 [Oscillospiraceae bacterium]|jgi:predicted membrane-bound dolichyl-phosphate-mannose-protein mannosyltransferase|nr:hypothetical protein [Oscillospiraceae bacterium]
MGHFGFSYIGLIYLLMLFIPNLFWAKHQPDGYDSSGESKLLLLFERVGQVATVAAALCFSDTNPREFEPWTAWLIASALLMVLYELYWLRYFRGGHTLRDFYGSFAFVPLPGAVLPVAAFLLLGIYGRLIWLIAAVAVLGIGHIGIHFGHLQKLKAN